MPELTEQQKDRHNKCAKEFGTFKGQVPMAIKKRVECIDPCIAQIVAALNAGGVTTEASCCGHGIKDGNIILTDGRVLIIKEYEDGMFIDKNQRLLGALEKAYNVSNAEGYYNAYFEIKDIIGLALPDTKEEGE